MNNSYADVLESYMIEPAMEAIDEKMFHSVFCDDDLEYKISTAKVKGKTYNLSEYRRLPKLMKVVIEDRWSESDFVKFIEASIDYSDRSKKLEKYYWAEEPNTTITITKDGETKSEMSSTDKRNQKIWENLKLICVSEDGGGNTLFYSKSKHGFYFMDHEKMFNESLRRFVRWQDALDGFKKFDLKYSAAKSYCSKLIDYYNVSGTCKLFSDNDNEIAFSLKTWDEYNSESILDKIVTRIRQSYGDLFKKIEKMRDDDKVYYDFYKL